MNCVLEIVNRVRPPRRGHCMAILAFLLPVLIGFTGLGIDLGVLSLADGQLETVADAASLAGAKQLNNPGRVAASYDLTADMTKARQRALAIGQANKVLGQAAQLLDNPFNLASGDVVIGYKDLAANSPFDPTTASSLFNSVRVVARRDAIHGGVVPAFFSKLLGSQGTALNVSSTATVQNHAINGFRCTPTGFTKLIPIALSKATYNAMLAGLTTDNFSLNGGGAVVAGSDGAYESSMYPVGAGSGNWGTLRIGVGNNGNGLINAQIRDGVPTTDIAAASPTGCSLLLAPTVGVAGNPGVSLGMRPALQGLSGKVVVVPIYDPALSTGSGGNFTYRIVAFAPVTVMTTAFHGIHTRVLVQPALIANDRTIILGAMQPAWTSGGVVRLRLTE